MSNLWVAGVSSQYGSTFVQPLAGSPDGTHWVTLSSPFSLVSAICYSPDLNLWAVAGSAVGVGLRLATTPNTLPPFTIAFDSTMGFPAGILSTDTVTSIIWVHHLSLFVATVNPGAGNGAVRILTSPTGAVWTPRTGTPFDGSNGQCWDVADNGSTLVAVGNDINNGPQKIMHSVNATSWTFASSSGNFIPLSVTWDSTHSVWAAVGNPVSNGSRLVGISSDGDSWTLAATPIDPHSSALSSVTVGASGKLVATGAVNYLIVVITSTDGGVTWVSQTVTAPYKTTGNYIAFSGTQYVLGLQGGYNTPAVLQDSSDANTWVDAVTDPFLAAGTGVTIGAAAWGVGSAPPTTVRWSPVFAGSAFVYPAEAGALTQLTNSELVGSHRVITDPNIQFTFAGTLSSVLGVPSAPTISASALSDASILVEWLAVPSTVYTVEGSDTGTGGWVVVGVTGAGGIVESGLAPSHTRYYRASATTTGGTSSWSAVVHATTSAAPIGPPPLPYVTPIVPPAFIKKVTVVGTFELPPGMV